MYVIYIICLIYVLLYDNLEWITPTNPDNEKRTNNVYFENDI